MEQADRVPLFLSSLLGEPIVKPNSLSRPEVLGPAEAQPTGLSCVGTTLFCLCLPQPSWTTEGGGQVFQGPSPRVPTNGLLNQFTGQGKERKKGGREREKEGKFLVTKVEPSQIHPSHCLFTRGWFAFGRVLWWEGESHLPQPL